MRLAGKIVMLTFNGTEEKAIEKAIAVLAHIIPLEAMTPPHFPESCQSSVANVICNLRKKIESDSRKPAYIKTIIGVGYKFASGK